MPKYVLPDRKDNPPEAVVDDITLRAGADPVELTAKQAERLRDAGVRLEDAASTQQKREE